MKPGYQIIAILTLLCILSAIVFQPGCNDPAPPATDTAAMKHQMIIDSLNHRQFVDSVALVASKEKNRADSERYAKAAAAIIPINKRVKQLVVVNERLRKDTAGRLANADSLALYAGILAHKEDSMRQIVAERDSGAADMARLYESALESANDIALRETNRRIELESQLRAAKTAPTEESRWAVGINGSYSMTQYGMTPAIGLGVHYDLIKFKKRKR